jgi:hypothetical protein
MAQREWEGPRSKGRQVERPGENRMTGSDVTGITRRIRADARPERELTWIWWNFGEKTGRDRN